MTSTRQRLEKQRQDLAERIRHAQLLASHAPTREALAALAALRSQLTRLDDMARAAAHGIVRPGSKYEPSQGPFITQAELSARQGLKIDRRVSYLFN